MLQSTLEWQKNAEAFDLLTSEPAVTILMAVYEGCDHLEEQIDSFAEQTHPNWRLIASVEGRDDGGRALMEDHPESWRIASIDGPGRGCAANFLNLMQEVRPEGYWAFSDQDDVWLRHKLTRALSKFDGLDPRIPAMYHSRSWVTDENLKNHRVSPMRRKPPGFSNAVVQNIAGGNTIVLNEAAARLAHAASFEAGDVPVHDWWLYQIITGAGGRVMHDPAPGLLYRQHDNNLIGANDSWRARWKRLKMVFEGTYQSWLDDNIDTLSRSAHRFTPENRAVLETIAKARNAPLVRRILMLKKAGIYRQTAFGSAVMWFSVLIGKF